MSHRELDESLDPEYVAHLGLHKLVRHLFVLATARILCEERSTAWLLGIVVIPDQQPAVTCSSGDRPPYRQHRFDFVQLGVGQSCLRPQWLDPVQPNDFVRRRAEFVGIRHCLLGRCELGVKLRGVRHVGVVADAELAKTGKAIVEELPVRSVSRCLVGRPVEILHAQADALPRVPREGELQRRGCGEDRARPPAALTHGVESPFFELGPQVHVRRPGPGPQRRPFPSGFFAGPPFRLVRAEPDADSSSALIEQRDRIVPATHLLEREPVALAGQLHPILGGEVNETSFSALGVMVGKHHPFLCNCGRCGTETNDNTRTCPSHRDTPFFSSFVLRIHNHASGDSIGAPQSARAIASAIARNELGGTT